MEADPHVYHLRSSAGLYGAEYMILGLMPALARAGIGSTLLCLDNPYFDEQELHTRAHALGLPAVRVPCRGRFDFASVQALRAILARDPRAVLHVHDYKSAAYAWLARGRIPVVATWHGQFSSTPSLHIYHLVESRLMRRFERVCIVAEEMRAGLVRAGVPEDNIRLIENGIDTDRFRPDARPLARRDFAIDDDALVYGAAMRLTAQKNPLGLIEAFALVAARSPRAVLAIAGDGPLRGAALARAAALGIAGRVRLLGARQDLERFYPIIDVFVLSSLYEGLPLALLEAMAAQRRIVATRVGHVAEVVGDLPVDLVAPGDARVLADAMLGAPVGRTAADESLRRRVVERYSTARMAADHALVYREVISRHERAAA
jgi:glycosyltransferase involved in cell wall biosynthesis